MLQFKKEDSRLIYEYILKTAPPNMTMLDIGARTGKWLVPFVAAFPNSTFHCFECEVCIEGYDHHCPWVTKCIGKGNIKFFYVFVASTFSYLFIMFLTVATIK